MSELELDLLRMQHARLLVQASGYAASANHDTSRGGWTCAWDECMLDCVRRAVQVEEKIEAEIAIRKEVHT